jgi:hypothetical protein
MNNPIESISKHILDSYDFNITESDIAELVLFFLNNPSNECWLYDKNKRSTFRVTREEIINLMLKLK